MKLIDFVICDDIRFEMGGKHTLVGVYSDINIPMQKGASTKLPTVLRLSFFIRLLLDKDITPDAFILEYYINNEKTSIPTINGKMEIDKNIRYLNLAFSHDKFEIKNVGKLSFKLTLFNKDKIIQIIEPDYNFDVNTIEISQP